MILSIIIPTYNERSTIESILKHIGSVKFQIDYEIIIVDDASIDRMREKEFLDKLKDGGEGGKIRIFKNRINRGKGFSVRKGIRRARGDIIIIQDADRELDPADIPKLIEPIINGEYDVVYGSRFMNKPRPEGMSFVSMIANKFLTALTNILFGLRLTDMETCYKAFRATILKSLKLRADRFAFEPEVTASIARMGIPIRELPVRYHGRNAREGKKIKAKDFVFAVMMLLAKRVG